jgi:aspartate-semialdehyde dehydrogenase
LQPPSRTFNTRTASGYAPPRKFRVGVLGATGAVGQRFLEHLEGHPWFEVTRVGASDRSVGKRYADAANWMVTPNVPGYVKDMKVVACAPADFGGDVDLVFSALVREEVVPSPRPPALPPPPPPPPHAPLPPQDAPVAATVEPAFRDAGVPVFSNARNFRMVSDVPLVVPQVNGDHLRMVTAQPSFAATGGYIVTNANCSTTGMVIALAPLQEAFGITAVHATTLQAVSGAGYPGLPSLDILDNVVPYISGEEEKLETEYGKIMGALAPAPGTAIAHPGFPLSAMVNRVHVRDGHCIALSVKLATPATPAAVAAALEAWRPRVAEVASLPSAPPRFIEVRAEVNRPQPRADRDAGRGYTTTVGRIREDPIYTVKMFVLSHNTVMGAAGSSILNAELAAATGLLKHKK